MRDDVKRKNNQPADRDESQTERALASFELLIETRPATDGDWQALRRALGFSRADEAWLNDRVPGVVRRGARADLQRVLARVEAAGFTGRVAARSEHSDRAGST
jgi:hypothetical protein